jgi:hypothetical protein
MRVLCFDIGIKNLSFIDVQSTSLRDPLRVERWDVLDISKTKDGYEISTKDFALLSVNMLRVLKDNFNPLDYNVIMIENQPVLKNPIMKSLQIVLYTFFTIPTLDNVNNTKVRFVNASKKLKANTILTNIILERVQATLPESKSAYTSRKKLAIGVVLEILREGAVVIDSDIWASTLQAHKKKDDMSDAFLMAINVVVNAFQST